MRGSPFLLCLAVGLAAAPLAAQVTATLTLTPGQNAISASSTLQTGSSQFPGGSGLNVTQWTGTITVQLDNAFAPTFLTIVSANLVALNSGYADPPQGGALANYSFAYRGSFEPLVVSLHDGQGAFASSPLPLSGSAGSYQFAPGGHTTGEFSSTLYYRTVMVVNNSTQVTSFSAGPNNGTLTSGAVTIGGSTLSLQFPLDFTGGTQVVSASGRLNDLSFRFFGTVNATGLIVVPEPSAWALSLGGAGLLGFVVRRQRGGKG